MATNDHWLALVQEETLEPELPICDPHHHLWDQRYDRVEPRYLLDEIRRDLTLGDAVAPVLEAHLQVGGGRFRGIRHGVAWDPLGAVVNTRYPSPPHLYLEPQYRRGFAQLARYGLSFEAWCYHPQLPELVDLARAFPETTIILDHFGGPLGVGPYAGQRDVILQQWRKDIAELATCANVVAKLGGLNMELNGFGWHERERPPTSQELMEATRPYYEHTIEQFGVARCLFESNFPVDKVTCSYNTLWNAFKRLTARYSPDEKAPLFHDTAARVYRL